MRFEVVKLAVIALGIFVAMAPLIARSTPLAAVKQDRAFVGFWKWSSAGDVVQIFADGSAKSQRGMGVWRERTTGITIRTFEVEWGGGDGTDVVTLDTDGRRISITSSRGEKFTGMRMEALRAE